MTFDGKNNLKSAISLFVQRTRYKLYAYEGLNISDNVRDLTFGEFQMYGRIDTNQMPIVPLDEHLVNVNEGDNNVRILDFVAEAFEDIQQAFRNACLLNYIPTGHRYLSLITPVRGYSDPTDEYARYIEGILAIYQEIYISEQNRRSQIITFKDYVNGLIDYLQVLTSDTPITFSSWQKSKNSSIFTSGIAIGIAELNAGDDRAKYVNFFSSDVFQYYLNICKQNGFNVSHNTPWVIFADLGSAVMQSRYLSKRNIGNTTEIFNNRFQNAHNLDIELLEDAIVRNYNRFISIYPIEKRYTICNNNNIKHNIIYREPTNSFVGTLSDSHIIRLYCEMKNIEEDYVFHKSDLNKIAKMAMNLAKRFDIQRGIGYVNEKYRQTFKSKFGGINSIIKATNEYFKNKLED